MVGEKNLEEKARVIKKLHDDSFYGILGTHPNANKEEIEKSFKISLRQLVGKKQASQPELLLVLKAYATLTSKYKKDYDDYLQRYKHGFLKAIDETCVGTSFENVKLVQPWSTEIKTSSILMQPWSTSNKITMQPWCTAK